MAGKMGLSSALLTMSDMVGSVCWPSLTARPASLDSDLQVHDARPPPRGRRRAVARARPCGHAGAATRAPESPSSDCRLPAPPPLGAGRRRLVTPWTSGDAREGLLRLEG